MDEFVGALREIVGIDQWTPGTGGADQWTAATGGVGGWTDAGVVWAALVPVDLTLIADVGERRIGRPRYRLTLRLPTMAAVTSRFRWRGRILAILRAEPDPRQRDRLTFLVEDRT